MPAATAADAPPTAPRLEPRLKIAMLIALPVVAAACGISAIQRAAWAVDTLNRQGFVAWPGSPDGFVWRQVPQRSFELVAIDSHGIGALVFVVGFAVWMGVVGWLLRSTAAPYVLAAASIAFELLVTGGVRSHGALPKGLIVDAASGSYVAYSKPGRLCDLRDLRVDKRSGGRGGPSYWITAHLPDHRTTDLYVLDDPAPAAILLDQINTLRAKTVCGAQHIAD